MDRHRRGSSTTEAVLCVALLGLLGLAAVKLFGLTIDRVIMGSRSTLSAEFDRAAGDVERRQERLLIRPAR